MTWRRLLIATAFLVAFPRPAAAHQVSVTHSKAAVDGRLVRYEILFTREDLIDVLDYTSGITPDEEAVRRRSTEIALYVVSHITISDGDTECAASPGLVDLVHDQGEFVRVQWLATCLAPISTLAIDYDLFFEFDPTHEAVLRVEADGDAADTLLRDGESRFVWTLADAPPSGTLAFIRSGVDHILDGTDHVAFLLTLLLVIVLGRGSDGAWRRRGLVESLRATALIVTSFTLAHTLTLISASLGWVSVPSRVVESVIAASIAYTAIENIIRPDVRWRFLVTFGFGLCHGLGFASVLQVMLPPDDIVGPLLSFNVGVELGQLLIVAVALPLSWLICGRLGAARYRRVLMPALSTALAAFGLIWLIERAFALTILGL
jgi:hypothetical protein